MQSIGNLSVAQFSNFSDFNNFQNIGMLQTLNARKGKAKYGRGQKYGGGSAMKTAVLELTSKKIPNKKYDHTRHNENYSKRDRGE